MDKENREVIIKLKVKTKDGKVYNLEKQETFLIEYGKSFEKTMSFDIDGKEHKFIIYFASKKGLFGHCQGEFMPKQEPVEIITPNDWREEVKFKTNPWRTEGKILVGFIIVSISVLIGFFIWSRRKRKI